MANRTRSPAPDRIQGTDGIRSEARPSAPGDRKSSLEIFLEKQIITDRFMELYVYAWAKRLNRRGKGGVVVVGWDPRDVDGAFSAAVVRGVRKAGMSAWVAGVVPTPLVPMLTVSAKAAGGVMITASHNPKDQNGIKLFSGYRGMKSLPDNDRALTRDVLKAGDIPRLKLTGKRADVRREALDLFERFSLEEENSWIGSESFRDIILIVDPANGSLSRVAAGIFRKARFGKVIEVNHRLDGNVNVYGGVADLEGFPEIGPEMIDSSSGLFRRHIAIMKLFEMGRKYRLDIESGKRRVCGAVFDADGDRFYMTEYDPFRDRLIVLSGDETAAHQAGYLGRRRSKGGLFLNTVESDLKAGRFAKEGGFDSTLTPVGDKWILSRILLAELAARAKPLKKKPTLLTRQLTEMKKTGVQDFCKLAELESAIRKLEPDKKKDSPSLPFVIGSEETGHNITAGRLPASPWSEGGEIVFCGNGLKSALNTFAATEGLRRGKKVQSFFKALERPFPAGFKKTDYVYYVHKQMFHKNSAVWMAVRKSVGAEASALDWKVRAVSFPEDPDMLYLALDPEGILNTDKGSAIFVRNSGTENKIGVNLRGPRRDSARLEAVGETIIRLLTEKMKDLASQWTRDERGLMEKMASQPLPESAMGLEPGRLRRLLAEMKKQGLAEPCEGGYRLTRRGKWVTIR